MRRVPRVMGSNLTTSFALTCPIFHSWEEGMVAGHTKPPREGPSTSSTIGVSPAAPRPSFSTR